jgi:catechol 2,3-dioxygenase-like lactoylglutathione lyase family enzyme
MKFNFNPLMPEIYVSDYEKSLHFYTEILGFKFEYGRENPMFAFLSYEGSQLMIQQIEADDEHIGVLEHPYGRGINFQINTSNIESLIESLKKNNYPLRKELKEYWRKTANDAITGTKEFQVFDPDGYFLRFSQDLGEKGE